MAVGFEGANTLVRLWDNRIQWMQNPYSLEWTVGGCYALGTGVYVGNNIKNDPDVIISRPLGHRCRRTKMEIYEGDIIRVQAKQDSEAFNLVCRLNASTFINLEDPDAYYEIIGNVFQHSNLVP